MGMGYGDGNYQTYDETFSDITGIDVESDLGDVTLMRNDGPQTRVEISYRNCQSIKTVSYTHLDVYKRQTETQLSAKSQDEV